MHYSNIPTQNQCNPIQVCTSIVCVSSIILYYVGLKKQQEQLPVQFILERLWEGASVVLTGEITCNCTYLFQ